MKRICGFFLDWAGAHRPFSESRVMYTSVYQALFRNGTTVEWQPGILSVHAYEFDYDQSTCVRAATEENMPGRKKPWPFTIDHTFIIIFEYNSTVRAGPESRSCVVPPPRPALFPHQVPSPADIGNQSNSRNVFFSCVVALKALLRRSAENLNMGSKQLFEIKNMMARKTFRRSIAIDDGASKKYSSDIP